MDEATAEQLSRYLDGDLDDVEAGLLEERLAAEPQLAAELDALRRLQMQVRSVADRMLPPAELDAPLRLPERPSPRAPGRVPPAVRWLGLAAGVALAVTVAVEVARRPAQVRTPATDITPREAPAAAAPQAAKAQAPEPATASRVDEQVETDAAPSAEPAPPASKGERRRLQPPEHEAPPVVEQKQSTVATGRAAAAPTESSAASGGALADRAAQPRPNETTTTAAAAPSRVSADATVADESAAFTGLAERGAVAKDSGGVRLELTGEDGAMVTVLALPAASPELGSRVVVTVADGVIVTIEPDAAGSAVHSALDRLIGQRLPGLPDGRYLGVVVGHNPEP